VCVRGGTGNPSPTKEGRGCDGGCRAVACYRRGVPIGSPGYRRRGGRIGSVAGAARRPTVLNEMRWWKSALHPSEPPLAAHLPSRGGFVVRWQSEEALSAQCAHWAPLPEGEAKGAVEIYFFSRGVNIIHGRRNGIPEHPVIADMERFGQHPFSRKRSRTWRKGNNLHSTGRILRP